MAANNNSNSSSSNNKNKNNNLRQQLVALRQSLFNEGFLDEFFIQLEWLQDEDNPHFVEEIINIYVADTAITITQLGKELVKAPINLGEISRLLFKVKGASGCVGARTVVRVLERMIRQFNAGNFRGLMDAYLLLKDEYDVLSARLMPYAEILRILREAAAPPPYASCSMNNEDAESVGSNDPVDD